MSLGLQDESHESGGHPQAGKNRLILWPPALTRQSEISGGARRNRPVPLKVRVAHSQKMGVSVRLFLGKAQGYCFMMKNPPLRAQVRHREKYGD